MLNMLTNLAAASGSLEVNKVSILSVFFAAVAAFIVGAIFFGVGVAFFWGHDPIGVGAFGFALVGAFIGAILGWKLGQWFFLP